MQTETNTTKTLDCGHPPSAHSDFTTGTAHTPDGREICWTCADQEQREDLKSAQHFMAYLVKHEDGPPRLTTWSGGTLADVTEWWERSVGFSGPHSDGKRVYFRATDVHGQSWYGNSPGLNMYVRMHRSKRQTR